MTTYKFNSDKKIRIDLFLRDVLPQALKLEISNSKIRRLIMAGCVRVNGKEVRIPSYTVFAGSEVKFKVAENILTVIGIRQQKQGFSDRK